jgi:protein involved in polysaccharide export with SLBB domain
MRRFVIFHVLLIFSITLGVGGCRVAATSGYQHFNTDVTHLKAQIGLGPGDIVEIRVYGEKALTGLHRVSLGGDIEYPFIGRVKISGLTPSQISKTLQNKLKKGYLRNPFVSVYVKEYHSKKIFVLGQVTKSGTFSFTKGMTVVEAITLAGGFKSSANQNYVVVTRKVGGKEKRIPVPVEKISAGLASNLTLRAGDIIFVPDRLL